MFVTIIHFWRPLDIKSVYPTKQINCKPRQTSNAFMSLYLYSQVYIFWSFFRKISRCLKNWPIKQPWTEVHFIPIYCLYYMFYRTNLFYYEIFCTCHTLFSQKPICNANILCNFFYRNVCKQLKQLLYVMNLTLWSLPVCHFNSNVEYIN